MKNKKLKDIDLQMKKMIKLAMAVALTAFAAACSNQDDMPNNENGATEFSVVGVINGYEEVADSRAKAETVVRIYWENNDTVYVYDGKQNIGFLRATVSEDNHAIAKLSGDLDSAPTSNKLTLVYSPLFGDTAPQVDGNGKLTLDLSTQSTEKVPFLIYGVLTELDQNVTDQVVNFQFATSVYKCNAADLDSESEITKATIDNINTKCVLTLSDNDNPIVGGETDEVAKGIITRTAGFLKKDERAIFTFALPVSPAAVDEETKRTITVTQGEKELVANFDNRKLDAAKSFNAMFVFTEADSDVDYDNAEYVDIAGVRWATKNLGATSIAESYEDCVGDIYMWGSLNTIYESKSIVNMGGGYITWNFVWKSGKSNGFCENYVEYRNNTTYIELLPDERDVVMHKVGGGWRMPTYDDFVSLAGACLGTLPDTSTELLLESQYVPDLNSNNPTGGIYYVDPDQTYLPAFQGVGGMLFVEKANPKKRVFFPFGFQMDEYNIERSHYGAFYHIKNTDSSDNTCLSAYLSQGWIWIPWDGRNRCCGALIRPVMDLN